MGVFRIESIEVIRKIAYPDGSPGGEEYERDRARECLGAVEGFEQEREITAREFRAEALRVFNAALDAVCGQSSHA